MVFQGCFKGVSRMLQGCFKGNSMVFQGNFKQQQQDLSHKSMFMQSIVGQKTKLISQSFVLKNQLLFYLRSTKRRPQQNWVQILIGLVVILTTNFLVIGGIAFSIHVLLIPWLVAYTVGGY